MYVEVDESGLPDAYPSGTHIVLLNPSIPSLSADPELAVIYANPVPILVGPVPLRNWYIFTLPPEPLPT